MHSVFFPDLGPEDVSETLANSDECMNSLDGGLLSEDWCGGQDRWLDSCQACKDEGPGFSCWALAISTIEKMGVGPRKTFQDALTSCGCL